ncbi:hypothetical protein [Neobacillus mesonae]|uniref:hypothetical protein n=1 Tax=Neobacillus mesonae TaxID=1193713 RepID=UPI00204150D5|nr:hypothetical protein [Neobacillus mesonae]MCM3567044.1 hypothetical protein [Neobacillus mesonae]
MGLRPGCEFQTETFTNHDLITINDGSQASPYPSPIVVSGMTGNIIKVTVKLIDISHNETNDIDIMLVGPDGQTNAIIMSDVGFTNAISNVTLTLDDQAPTALPDTQDTPVSSGTFKPTNAGTVLDPFPGGAPQPSGGDMLSSFNFTNPNGTWNLYVVDSQGQGDAGMIAGGWELTIVTSTCTP